MVIFLIATLPQKISSSTRLVTSNFTFWINVPKKLKPTGIWSPTHMLCFLRIKSNLDLSIDLWDRMENIYTYIHKGTVNVFAQVNAFKIFSSWYETPLRLHKIVPNHPPQHWRCAKDLGSLFYIWWSCPLIQSFWKEVHRLTNQITTLTLDYLPAQFLLQFWK